MPIVSAVGIGSGTDINGLVNQLVTAEGQPAFNAIKRQEDTAQARLSGLGTLKSALSDFKSVVSKLKDGSLFQTHKAASSNETFLKATAGIGSVAGSYSVEVVKLAAKQKSISTAEFINSSDIVGNGSLTFTTSAGATFDVTIDGSNNTLQGVRNAINSAEGNDSVTASIINVDNGAGTGTIAKLVLTARNSGTDNAFTVTGSDDDTNAADNLGLSRLFSTNLNPQTIASNAIINVDGQTATRSTNSISDVLQGVTLELQPGSEGSTLTVDLTLDNEGIKKTIGDFVASYNKLHTTSANLGKFSGNANGSGNGALIGDSTLRLVSSQLRQNAGNLVSSAPGNFNSLAMIGITINKDGVMALEGDVLDKALQSNLSSVANVLTSSDGVAVRLDAKLNQFLQSGGPLDSQQTSLKDQISRLGDRRDAVQRRLDNLQRTLQKQFIAMDVAVGRFQSTGSFLTNALAKL